MTRSVLSILLLFMLLQAVAHAGPASPDPVDLRQPDGSSFTASIHGDEFQNWTETVATGHTVIRNQHDGFWEYAEPLKNGQLRPSGIRVLPNGRNAPAAIPRKLQPPRNREAETQLQQMLLESYQQRAASSGSSALGESGAQAAPGDWVPTPIAGTKKMLVIMVGFADTALTTTPANWASTVFDTAASSVAKYYQDNSFATLAITPVAHTQAGNPPGVVTVTLASTHPNTAGNYTFASDQAWGNSALQLAAGYVDFNSLDTNGDGRLDTAEVVIYFIAAGYETSAGSGLTPSMWAHAWWTSGTGLTAGTKNVRRWALNGEKYNATTSMPMGVIAHELGHQLCGLPDLYDISGTNSALGNFSLMAGGSWGRNVGQVGGTTPTLLDAWSREFLGWTTPVVPTEAGTISLAQPLASASSAYKLINPAVSSSEYFLLENRQPTGWDAGLRGYASFGSGWSGGLLITHIDTTAGTLGYNDINCYFMGGTAPAACSSRPIGPQGVVPVQASTVGCDMLTGTACRGAATTLFYTGNNANWSPLTTPGSNYYSGTATNFSLTGISAPVATMTAALSLTPPVLHSVEVTRSGGGSGSVTSVPAGITCGSSCTAAFPENSAVVLTATPAAGSIFTGWGGGGCSGNGTCTLTITADSVVNAAFAPSTSVLAESFDAVTPAALPSGWQTAIVVDTSNPNPAWKTNAGTRNPGGAEAHSGANLALFNAFDVKVGDAALLISPPFSLEGLANGRIGFWLYRDSAQYGATSTNDDRVEVLINSAPTATGATLLGTAYRLTALAPVVASSGWYEFSFPIPDTFSGASTYLLLKGVSGHGNDVHLDDIAVTAAATAATTPSQPTGVTALPGNGQATVSFAASAYDGGSAILDYTATASPGGLSATGSGSPLIVTGLANGTAYTFTVTARNAVGSSAPSSASASVTPITVPDPPVIGIVTPGNRQVTVSFTPPTTDGGSAVLDYTATATPGGLTASGSGSPLTITGLTNDIPYTVTVTARNSAGSSAPSAPSASATPYLHISIGGTGYPSIAAAYAASVNGSTLQLRDLTFNEALDCNRDLAIFLKGGYDSSFTTAGGFATLSGPLTITSGSVTLENIVVR